MNSKLVDLIFVLGRRRRHQMMTVQICTKSLHRKRLVVIPAVNLLLRMGMK